MIRNKMSKKINRKYIKEKKNKIESKIKKFDYKKIANLITKRFQIKILCLLMAFILFLYVRYQTGISTIDVNNLFNKDAEKIEFNDIVLNINNLDSRFNIKSKSPLIVEKLILEVNKNFVGKISEKDLFLYLNLKNITNAGFHSNLSVEANIPAYAKLIQIEPSLFDIEMELR